MEKPGRYERALTWLAAHPGATINDVAVGIEGTRSRALLVLRYGIQVGAIRRHRGGPREPWRWEVTS
jgi:hypothetical protein